MTSFSRGHLIVWDYDTQKWLYEDDRSIHDGSRPCKRCGKFPTKEGYDACLGHIKGVTSACCGHGVTEPILIKNRRHHDTSN